MHDCDITTRPLRPTEVTIELHAMTAHKMLIGDCLNAGFGVYTYENKFFRYEGEWKDGKKQGWSTTSNCNCTECVHVNGTQHEHTCME